MTSRHQGDDPSQHDEPRVETYEDEVPACESGWTGDRCSLPLGHTDEDGNPSPHSNE